MGDALAALGYGTGMTATETQIRNPPTNKHHSTNTNTSGTRKMATQQDEGGVPFSMAHEMQQFRLFELPPEIVELLDAPNPPL
jgi:hypothetical protein